MPSHYMILCNARTGSNYLVSILNQHPDIDSHNELFTTSLRPQRLCGLNPLNKKGASAIDTPHCD